jgi:hypothetical protein
LPQAQVKQKRHGEHGSVTVTFAEEFLSAPYDLSMFIRGDVRHSRQVTCNNGLGDLERLALDGAKPDVLSRAARKQDQRGRMSDSGSRVGAGVHA